MQNQPLHFDKTLSGIEWNMKAAMCHISTHYFALA